jgi:hypothetical protein
MKRNVIREHPPGIPDSIHPGTLAEHIAGEALLKGNSVPLCKVTNYVKLIFAGQFPSGFRSINWLMSFA